MRRTGLTLLACASAFALISGSAAAQSPASPAEYAIRWDIRDGGPQSAAATLAALSQQPSTPAEFEVRYFDITAPSDAPAEFTCILRQRRKGQKKHELTFKYRGDHALSSWRCPLSEAPDESKEEVDVSILAPGQTKRAFSYSCTLESKDPISPPAALQARPKDCTSKMSRLKAGKLKVEEWHLPGNLIMVEVSRNGLDSKEDLEAFRQEVVEKLLRAGVKPSDRSKTELGSGCP